MMNNRSMINMVFAIAIGYLIVSTVPSKVETLMSPQLSFRGEPEMLSPIAPDATEPPISSGESKDNSNVLSADEASSQEIETSPETMTGDQSKTTSIGSDENLVTLYMWWTMDLIIALGVYYITRRLLS